VCVCVLTFFALVQYVNAIVEFFVKVGTVDMKFKSS